MTKVECYGYTQGGKLHILNEKRFKAELAALKDMDVHITIRKKGKRSSQQNRYYFGVVLEEIRLAFLEKGTRVTAEELHTAFKAMFNPLPFANRDGVQLLPLGGSTAELNKEQFGHYLDSIIEWAAKELQIAIPLPGTQTDMFNLTAA